MIFVETGRPPRQVLCGCQKSPVGQLLIGVTEEGILCRVGFLKSQKRDELLKAWRRRWPNTLFYDQGQARQPIRDPEAILLVGTPFQRAVWKRLTQIPYGQVRTYGELARSLDRKGAARAVGTACGANPVPFFVPCHRVVAAQNLGGFSSGLEIKRALLRAEGMDA